MQTYNIIGYEKETGHHTIQEEGSICSHESDLFVAANFPELETIEETHAFAESLVGKTIRIQFLQHYVSIAQGVQVIEEEVLHEA